LTPYLLVAAGGAMGSVLRFGATLMAIQHLGLAFPWGTLAVNVIGSVAIGIVAGIGVDGAWRLFLIPGLLGGFTTFSAFSLETLSLWQRAWWLAVLYVSASLCGGFAGFAAGHALAARGG
jgi:fluoride exporter